MRKLTGFFTVLLMLALSQALSPAPAQAAPTPPQVYGVWHCGDDACIWGTERSITEFDSKNHWIVDRGDGRPSVNVVVLSFVQPLKLLHRTTDPATLEGSPRAFA